MGLFGPTVTESHEEAADDARGSSVTPARVADVDGVTSDGERIEYMGKGSKVDIDDTTSHEVSVFDTERDIRQATRGYVDVVVTDEGIYMEIPRILRSERYFLDYDEVEGATVQERSLHHYLVFQTSDRYYHAELYEPDKLEAEEMAKYVRYKAEERPE